MTMTKREKEIEVWWEKIEAISDADLQIGYRVSPRNVVAKNATKPAKRKSASAMRPARLARK